ncbi:MAG: DUF47 family protein [Candidatus Nitrosocaldaceae archaeon]
MLFRDNMQKLLEEHMEQVLETLRYLQEMIKSIKETEILKAIEFSRLVNEYEKNSDAIHRRNVEKICKGSIFGYLREDIIRFMELADNIADVAKEAVNVLIVRDIQLSYIKAFVNYNLISYIEISINAAKELYTLIKILDKKRDAIINQIRVIEGLEEESDRLKLTVLKELYNNSSMYDILTLLQFKEFIYLIDAIADNSEDASDIIQIMLAKGYS